MSEQPHVSSKEMTQEHGVSRSVFDAVAGQRDHWKEQADNNAKLLEQALSIIREYYWIETKRAGQACDERAGRFLKGLGKL